MCFRGDSSLADIKGEIGIPEGDLPHIFEPFYRVDRSRSRSAGGAGLGLVLVQDIVAKHGGSIEIKSAPGKGITAMVDIPVTGQA